MEALPDQNLPGYINYVVGSLYGHPAAAFRAKEKLHATLTRGGLFKQSKYDNCLYWLVHPIEKLSRGSCGNCGNCGNYGNCEN